MVFLKYFINTARTFFAIERNKNKYDSYHQWKPWKKTKLGITKLKKELKEINNNIIEKLIKSCSSRKIIIPLSAGYDSRFILSGLIDKGYKNIITFSYGRKNNREAKKKNSSIFKHTLVLY